MKKEYYSLFIPLALLFIIVIVLFLMIKNGNGGNFVYVLDDPYIHMTIAKNFALYGVWGISEHLFTSSSSSLLWSFILAIFFKIFGVNAFSVYISLILNVLLALVLLYVIWLIAQKEGLPQKIVFVLLLVVILVTPLPAMIFVGMEHTLQILLIVSVFFYYFAGKLYEGELLPEKLAVLVFLSTLAVLCRYESLALVGLIFLHMMLNKKVKGAFILGLSVWVPILLYGFYSVSNDWYLLPSSVLLKGNSFEVFSTGMMTGVMKFILWGICCLFYYEQSLLVFVFISLLLLIFKSCLGYSKNKRDMLIIYLLVLFAHVQFARLGWFYRYEAYLVCLGIVLDFIIIYKYVIPKFKEYKALIWQKFLVSIIVIVVLLPLFLRSYNALIEIPIASNNIYSQQYHMAQFLKRYYSGENVAINDLGAISYFSKANILDLFGLGSVEITRAKLSDDYTTEKIADLVKQKKARMIVVHDHWFEKYGGLPASWVRVCEWKIQNNVVCGSPVVVFYAPDVAEAEQLKMHLQQYEKNLPEDVEVTYRY